jgi:hypothetical protein
MTETSPTTAAGKKKGLSPLAWIGIGCLALILISGVLFFSCSYFVATKAKDFAGELEKNPVKTLAETAVRFNPNLEVVSSDDSEGTMTIRDKATGETMTLGYKDIADGKFSMQSGEGQIRFDTSQAAEGGLITVEDGDGGTAQITVSGAKLPSWIPIYPGTEPSANFVTTSGEQTTGSFGFNASTGPNPILEFYRERLEADGFTVETTTFPTGGSLTARREGREMTLFLAGWGDTLRAQGGFTETQ